jgi:L-lactate dehydrogenase (cytochrome)
MWDTFRSVVRFRSLSLDPVERRLRRAITVDDLRRVARRRMPRGAFDYIDGGAEDERTLAENVRGFSRITFRPRVLRDVAEIDTSATVLGTRLPMPLALSPTGFNRIADPEGELAVARAAQRAGLPYSLSTLGTRSIEEVAAVNTGRKWFQVYVWNDRGLVKEMIARARDAGFEALILTVDTAVQGRRERDVRHGFVLPPRLGLDTLLDGVLHPGWTWDFMRAEPIRFANVVGRGVSDGTEAVELADLMNNQFDSSVGWDDVDWLRSVWDGPLIVKGIQTVADAMIAADRGIDAVALSNHGGRQLDSAPSPIELVAPVTDAVGDRIEVYCDGGIRRGSDVVKAVALGATACTIGRAYLFGLGAAGERGVDHALGLLADDVRRTMALLGVTSVADLTRDYVG